MGFLFFFLAQLFLFLFRPLPPLQKNQKIFFDRINFIINSIEEMHKKICISSLFFCSFALKCNLGIFIEGEKYDFFCES